MTAALNAARRSATLLAALLAMAGCKAAKAPLASMVPVATVTVTVSPDTASISTGGTQGFTASVSGSADTAVTWSVQEGASGGSVSPASGATTTYTAPGTAGTYHVVARSHADSNAIDTAEVTVSTAGPVSVVVTPTNAAPVACANVTFHATVTGSADTAVTWTVQEGSPAGGTITTGGVYTASATAGTYHVVARSHADTTKTDTVAVVVGEETLLSVNVTPSFAYVLPTTGTQTFTATITTSCGTRAATATLPVPGGEAN